MYKLVISVRIKTRNKNRGTEFKALLIVLHIFTLK